MKVFGDVSESIDVLFLLGMRILFSEVQKTQILMPVIPTIKRSVKPLSAKSRMGMSGLRRTSATVRIRCASDFTIRLALMLAVKKFITKNEQTTHRHRRIRKRVPVQACEGVAEFRGRYKELFLVHYC